MRVRWPNGNTTDYPEANFIEQDDNGVMLMNELDGADDDRPKKFVVFIPACVSVLVESSVAKVEHYNICGTK